MDTYTSTYKRTQKNTHTSLCLCCMRAHVGLCACLNVFICVTVGVYVKLCERVGECVSVSIRLCIHVHVHVRVRVRVHVHVRARACVCMCVFARAFACIYIHSCIRVWTFTHKSASVYVHANQDEKHLFFIRALFDHERSTCNETKFVRNFVRQRPRGVTSVFIGKKD